MKQLLDSKRVIRLVDEAIETTGLDLTGLTVLTEAASGVFITTPLIAARAGAFQVFAVTRSSTHGSAEEVMRYGREWALKLGVEKKISFSESAPQTFADRSDIVTNLGFVRPINKLMVERLPKHAAIALMWEPWEFRGADIDITACQKAGIPVIGTRETDSRLMTFDYVGILVSKLLLETGVEILGSRIVLIGTDPFGESVEKILGAMGAKVLRLTLPKDVSSNLDNLHGESIERADALVIVENRDHRELIGLSGGIHPDRLLAGDTRLIHVCGTLDDEALLQHGISKWPERRVSPGFMTVTTDYVGPKPVIDLHCAGLRVAEVAARVRVKGGNLDEAIEAAQATGLGLKMDMDNYI